MPPRRILIVYASRYGQTAKIARCMADRLRASGANVVLSNVKDVPRIIAPATYDGVIVGASINFGKHPRSIRRFARANRDTLQGIHSAFFSVSGAEASPNEASREVARQYIANFIRETGWKPAMSESIAGAMAYTKYSPLMRWMIRRISQKEGGPADTARNHEFTDWEQVRRFTERFAKELGEPETAVAASTS